tara:strand:+ start:224 stop:595 length:372 start_codon:yes stop_codon:yes gene_type:complete
MIDPYYLSYLIVGLGGGIGAALRYWVSQNIAFPFGTLTVNIIGSFIIGIAFAIIIHRFGEKVSLFFVTGVLGGFTTFSAFSLDVLKLYQDDKVIFAGIYVVTTFTASIFAVFLAASISRQYLN